MTFIARIIKHSLLWKSWTQRHATGGSVADVAFRSVGVNAFESGPLTAAEVARLRHVVGVCLVSFGTLNEAPAPKSAPVPLPFVPPRTTPAAQPFRLSAPPSPPAQRGGTPKQGR
jgi:hypothetical protein